MPFSRILIVILFVLLIIPVLTVSAQNEISILCGDVIESEFTQPEQIFRYSIDLNAGDSLNITAATVGDYLRFGIYLYTPNDQLIEFSGNDRYHAVVLNPSIVTEGLPSNGRYIISIQSNNYEPQGTGVFTLYIGCTVDGTIINPNGMPPTTPTNDLGGNDSSIGTFPFSGVGFPGLAPVDFSNVAELPLPFGVPMGGAITPMGGEILGFTLDANAGDILDLSFTRLSGNLNIGVVVLSADNQVVFQASLVTSQTMNSRFMLPAAGTYTIGIFRIDLLPPDNPEATAFQIQGTLNPQ